MFGLRKRLAIVFGLALAAPMAAPFGCGGSQPEESEAEVVRGKPADAGKAETPKAETAPEKPKD